MPVVFAMLVETCILSDALNRHAGGQTSPTGASPESPLSIIAAGVVLASAIRHVDPAQHDACHGRLSRVYTCYVSMSCRTTAASTSAMLSSLNPGRRPWGIPGTWTSPRRPPYARKTSQARAQDVRGTVARGRPPGVRWTSRGRPLRRLPYVPGTSRKPPCGEA